MKDRFESFFKTSREFVEENKKIIASVTVLVVLFFACASSVVARANERSKQVGVTIALSSVKAEEPAFSGERFTVSGLSYDNMKSANFDTNQLAQLEKTEKQVEEILAARSQDKTDQAVYEALTASSITVSSDDNQGGAIMVAGGGNADPIYMDSTGVYEYVGDFRVTAYCPCPICCGQWSNMENPTTASGTRATQGRTIAADSRFPFGTQLSVGGQVYTVEDRGGAIQGNRIDVYFNSHSEALAWATGSYSVYRKVQ